MATVSPTSQLAQLDDVPPGWRASFFSLRTWWCHAVWLVAAIAAGAGAWYFIFIEHRAVAFTQAQLELSPYLPALTVAVGMIVISRLRDRVFPGTEGTGIPQAIAALHLSDDQARTQVLSLRIALGKLVLMTLGLFAGATIGREGPTVQLAACCLYVSRRLARFPRYAVERGLILAGSAAGIAAAFNTPIAGVVFAIEEIGRSFDKRSGGLIVRTGAVASLVCIVPLSDYLFYGELNVRLHTVNEWLVTPAIGVVAGFLGGCFARAVASVVPRVARLARRRPYAVASSLGLALGVLGLISNGATYGGGDEQAHAILLSGETLPATYALAKATASFVSLISAIPGGLFAPTLSVGAGLGQLTAAYLPWMDRQAVVLLVMGAYFAGVVQSPITAAVILFEMTAARFMLLPLLVAAVLAYESSRVICPVSLYEQLAGGFLRRHPQLESSD
jgi:H+/Cl- antiporter ClcA